MTLICYRDRAKSWRWRLVAANGRVLADSGEGYRRKIDCLTMGQKLFPKATRRIR